MSYPYRNRTKLSDKLRGKSGDEILNELRNQLDADRKMFFESTPSWNSTPSPGPFSRAGNPLDETMPRGHQDIRSHLDDLAQRHPEFAEHLRCPPWAGEMGAPYTWRQSRRGSGSNGDNTDCGAEGGHWEHGETDPSPSHGRERQANLPQHGLRNTVDLGQQQQEQSDNHDKNRGQRAWSAPPDNRTQIPPDPPRFVSRLDFNPVNTNSTSANADQGKPPVAPKQPQAQQTQIPVQQQSSPNTKREEGKCVRHIPIFVEGRDEPLLPKNTTETTQNIPVQRVSNPPQSQPSSSSFAYGRPSHFTNTHFQNQGQSPPQKQQPQPQKQQQQPQKQQPQQPQKQQPQQPKKQPPSPSQTSTAAPQQQQQKVPSAETEVERKSVPQAHKQPRLNDPIAQVQAIQKDVNDLKLKVEQFSGSSGKDKDYMYLDEMLTRNLLKLDNIETEGKENVRQARKDVIRNIQQCISLLESKVPGAEENQNIPEDEITVTEHNTMEVGNNGTSSEPTQQDNVSCSQEEGKLQDEDIPSDANKQQENENIPLGQIDNPVESEHKQSVMEVEPNTDTKENIVREAANVPPETSSETDKIITENNSKDSCKNADVLEKPLGDVTTQMQVDNVESNKVEDSSNMSATEKVEGQEKMEVDSTTSADKNSCQEPVAYEITEGTPKTDSEQGTEVTSEISSTCGVAKDNELVATGKPENSDVTSGTDSKNETVKNCDISKPVGQVSKLPKSPKGSPKKGKKGT